MGLIGVDHWDLFDNKLILSWNSEIIIKGVDLQFSVHVHIRIIGQSLTNVRSPPLASRMLKTGFVSNVLFGVSHLV